MTGRTIGFDGPVDVGRTLGPWQRGTHDPCMRSGPGFVERAMRTPDGPAVLRLEQAGSKRVLASAVGPGAGWALETAPPMAGALDDVAAFDPGSNAILVQLWRRRRGIRMSRGPVFPALVAAILEQKVTGLEARRAWRGLVRATSEPAPGGTGIWLPPDPNRLMELPSFEYHRAGVEGRRANVLREVARRSARIDELDPSAPGEARRWLELLPGIGPWTSAETARLALGDPDAISVGDFHLPHLVAWTLAGEPRATDQRMLELLEPWAGQRGRIQRLLEAGGARAPAFGPRHEVRSIARI